MNRNEQIKKYIKFVTGHTLKPEAISKILEWADTLERQEPYAVLYKYIDSQSTWDTKPVRKAFTTLEEISRQRALWNGNNSLTYRWDCYDADGNPVGTIYSVNPILF